MNVDTKEASQELPPIPYVDPKLQEKAENEAIKLLIAGKPIPAELGNNIRNIGDFGDLITLDDFSLLDNSPYIKALHLDGFLTKNSDIISKYKYLETLNLKRTRIKNLPALHKLQRLTTLDVSDTHISEIDTLHHLNSVESLYISDSKISDLSPLKDHKKLSVVLATNLNIKDWSPLDHVDNVAGRPDDWVRKPK